LCGLAATLRTADDLERLGLQYLYTHVGTFAICRYPVWADLAAPLSGVGVLAGVAGLGPGRFVALALCVATIVLSLA
jgi:hypothetical protein